MRADRSFYLTPAALVLLALLGACSAASRMAAAPDGAPTVASATGEAEVAVGQTVGDGIRVVAALPNPVDASGAVVQRIAANDVLTVDVFRADELDTTTEVDATGNVTLPLVGPVRASGKTLTELQADLKRLYGSRYLQNPEITVSMKTSAGQRVTLDGEFREAGIYPTGATTSLIQAIAQAGGFTNIADPAKVFVFRTVGGERLVAQFNVDRIREGKAPDPRIAGGDVVVAFPSGIRVFGQNLREALGVATSASGILR